MALLQYGQTPPMRIWQMPQMTPARARRSYLPQRILSTMRRSGLSTCRNRRMYRILPVNMTAAPGNMCSAGAIPTGIIIRARQLISSACLPRHKKAGFLASPLYRPLSQGQTCATSSMCLGRLGKPLSKNSVPYRIQPSRPRKASRQKAPKKPQKSWQPSITVMAPKPQNR